MDNVECPKCAKSAVPKLWHYRPFMGRFRHLKTQHLCPFCGCCMYETGGEITFFGKLVLVFLALPIGLVALSDFLRTLGKFGPYLATALSLIFVAAIAFWLGRTIHRRAKDFFTSK